MTVRPRSTFSTSCLLFYGWDSSHVIIKYKYSYIEQGWEEGDFFFAFFLPYSFPVFTLLSSFLSVNFIPSPVFEHRSGFASHVSQQQDIQKKSLSLLRSYRVFPFSRSSQFVPRERLGSNWSRDLENSNMTSTVFTCRQTNNASQRNNTRPDRYRNKTH